MRTTAVCFSCRWQSLAVCVCAVYHLTVVCVVCGGATQTVKAVWGVGPSRSGRPRPPESPDVQSQSVAPKSAVVAH